MKKLTIASCIALIFAVSLIAQDGAQTNIGIGLNSAFAPYVGPSGVALSSITIPVTSSYGFVGVNNGLKLSGTSTCVAASDGGCYLFISPGGFNINSASLNLLTSGSGSALLFTTAPTVTSAGTSPTIAFSNGTVTLRVNVGTGGTATTIVLALPAAANNWNCSGENITGSAANRADSRVAFQSSTASSATLQYQTVSTGVAKAFTASDIVAIHCDAE